jgi:Protein of unknown function (DUF4012)
MDRMRVVGRVVAGVIVLLLAAGVVGLQARGELATVERDLNAARASLAQAGRLRGGSAAKRLALVAQAEASLARTQGTLESWPLRPFAAVPMLGRDVRLARTIARASTEVTEAAERVVVRLGPLQRRPSRGTILATAAALHDLARTLHAGADRVKASRSLLGARARMAFTGQALEAERSAKHAGRGLELLGGLYGPRGTIRFLLAFQNPAELRGTGGIIGQLGILESSPSGPVLREVLPREALQRRLRIPKVLPPELAGYRRLGVHCDWRAVNIPPDLLSMLTMFERSQRVRLDGVVTVDPLAVAHILRASGPIVVEGRRLNGASVLHVMLVDAYVRYANDNDRRRRFLGQVAQQTAGAMRRALVGRSVELLLALAHAARGRHLQVYSRHAATQGLLIELGIAGTARAPATGDYLQPVGVNAAGNKLDSFLYRRLRYRVRLDADGKARSRVSMTLRNMASPTGLPRYVIGPFDRRFKAGENRLIQVLRLSDAYGFTQATRNGERVRVSAHEEFGGLALGQTVSIPPGRSATLAYDLVRAKAVQADGERLRYRLLARPQGTVNPDKLELTVTAPAGWEFVDVPSGAAGSPTTALWSGSLDRERAFEFVLARAG